MAATLLNGSTIRSERRRRQCAAIRNWAEIEVGGGIYNGIEADGEPATTSTMSSRCNE